MSGETTNSVRGRKSVSLMLLPVVTAGGIYVGMRWHAHFERWLVPSAGTQHNRASDPAASPTDQAAAAKQLWTCGMHPQVIQEQPGECPICHMKLTPLAAAAGDALTGAAATSGTVRIDPAVVQNMGVRTVTVSRGTLSRHIRAMATIVEPESARTDINLRVSGWIQRLHADTDGMTVRKGDALFDLYSPELRQAIEEFIASRRAAASIDSDPSGANQAPAFAADSLVVAAASRLRALGLTPEQIAEVGGMEHAPPTITYTSPVDGIVVEKANVYAGSGVMAGQLVLRLADRSTMWVQARVPEGSLHSIARGQRARVRLTAGGEPLEGEVAFIHPNLDEMTRTALVRIVVPNADGSLRVGMYATAEFDAGTQEPTTILPREAIIDAGETQTVIVSVARGRFEPRRVTLGASGDGGMVQVLSGVAPGETVVVSGQFLIDSESRLREAIAKFLGQSADGAMSSVLGSPGTHRAPAPNLAPKLDAKAPAGLVDGVIAEYLAIAEPFGRELPDTPPASAESLLAAIDALGAKAEGKDAIRLVSGARDAVLAMRSQTTDKQRELFKAVSAAVIAIVDSMPPSESARADLFVANCPMAKADWLQRGEDLGNPFYSEDMTECGSIVRRVGDKPGTGGTR